MIEQSDKPTGIERPTWVQTGLYGLGTRGQAVGFMYFSYAAAVICVIVGFWIAFAFIGVGLVGAAYWYQKCIAWVDQNYQWREYGG